MEIRYLASDFQAIKRGESLLKKKKNKTPVDHPVAPYEAVKRASAEVAKCRTIFLILLQSHEANRIRKGSEFPNEGAK